MSYDIDLLEKLIGLINDICSYLKLKNILIINPTHGGFIPLNLSKELNIDLNYTDNIYDIHQENFLKNYLWATRLNWENRENSFIEIISSVS